MTELPHVVLSGLSKRYRTATETVVAADEVDLEVRAGEFVCISGASGSGKSTLLNIMAGLMPVDSGSAVVAGVAVQSASEEERARLRLRHVGVVFQAHNLIEEFTAQENVALPLEADGHSWQAASVAASRQLARVGLDGLEQRMPAQLSGGQRQRVGIARALVGDKTVLLADEPTGALDSAATDGVFRLIRELCDGGLLAVVCSHDLRCRTYADRSYTMTDGRLRAAEQVPS